jgi:hypothetical protein
MREYPKQIKRQLRELNEKAHENELNQELAKLALEFEAWKQGRISGDELNDLIHAFHHGPSRELFNRYTLRGNEHFAVAGAVVQGILRKEDIPDEVWPYLQDLII